MARGRNVTEKGKVKPKHGRFKGELFQAQVNSGGRLPALEPKKFTQEQWQLASEIAKSYNGRVDGPHAIWFRVPELAKRASSFNTWLRLEGNIQRRLFELMVLIVARHYKAQFEWYVHERSAVREGVLPAVVETIRTGGIPKLTQKDERLVYNIVKEINENKTLSLRSYRRAVTNFGEENLIELITGIGFYTMVAVMCNVFEAPLPKGEKLRLS